MKRYIPTHRYQFESLESRRLLATYTVDLGMLPGGVTSEPSDINASGQVVGTTTMADGSAHAFIWRNGVTSDLGSLGGGDSRAHAINDAGQVVGQTSSGVAPYIRAFLVTPEDTDGNGAPDRWFRDSNSDGKNDLMRDLGTIGGHYGAAIANDVNNLGQVVGTTSTVGPVPYSAHAFRWQNGVMTDMGTFGMQNSYANAINDAGQITGSSIYGAFLWKAGVVTLGVGGTDINSGGQLIDDYRIWTPTVPNGSSGTFATLGQLPLLSPDYPEDWSIQTFARSINAAGQVVGIQEETFNGENAGVTVDRGIRWVGGVPQELPLETAAAINDAGQIVGTRFGRTILTEEGPDGPVKTWVGPASGGNWANWANWSPTGVPTAGDLVTISGKSVNIAAGATIASLTLTGGASLAHASNGSGVLRTSTLFISGDSKLNLNNNAMILSSVSASGVTNYLSSGYANGAWNGNGINSAVAASTPQSALGYALASDLFGTFPASFQGQSVNASDFLIRYTRNGDANLDGVVNSIDFASVAMNFNQSGRRWSQGDFNFDGKVNALDFNALASRYGSSSAPLASAQSVEAVVVGASPAHPSLFSEAEIRDEELVVL